jgi:D-alanyl-D-alanine carboxypeptidase/D-alanyl-D-alanine-endopeptidase (penicillin-binding protein 4)
MEPAWAAAPLSSLVLVPAGGVTRIVVHRELGSERLRVAGAMAADAPPRTFTVTVADPTLFAARALTHALRAAGIEVRDDAGTAVHEAGVTVSEWRSPPLATLLMPVLRDSDNLYAEQLFRASARVAKGAGDGAAASQHAGTVLQALGVDVAGMVLADGSGLSRRDLVQPRQLAQLLVAMQRSAQRGPFVAALPIAGVSGTLKSRFRGTAAAGRVLAKTGTIARVACLSGYVPRPDGEPLVFSIMLNDFTCSDAEARAAIDAFVLQLVAFADADSVAGLVRT